MNKNYYENEAVSQSRLKRLINSPMSYKNNTSISGPSLTLGSLFENMVLPPYDTSMYYVTKAADIQPVIKNIWDDYYSQVKIIENFDDIDEQLLDDISLKHEYRVTQKNARLKYVLADKSYFDTLVKGNDKIIVSTEMNEVAKTMAESIKTNEFTKDIIKDDGLVQLEIYWNLEHFDLKSLLDYVEIDEKNKTIQPWDLKSTGYSTTAFKKSIYKFRYDFQAAFYTFALKFKYPDYKILPFKFLVESSSYPGTPLVYQMSDYALSVGAFGGNVDGVEYKGFTQCLEQLQWHCETNIWNYTKEQYENKGLIIV